MCNDKQKSIVHWQWNQKANRSVSVFDTTLRDGDQTPGVHFSYDDKVAMARMLDSQGVGVIEAGFPASSPGDFKAVQRIAEIVENAEVAALARCVPADIEQMVEALKPARKPVGHLVLGVSDIHLTKKFNITRPEAIRIIRDSIAQVKEHFDEVQFSFEDATRTETAFLRNVIQVAVDAGATRINLPDTVGCALPNEYGRMIADAVAVTKHKVMISAHCHNDLGMATANSVAAVQNGAAQVEVTVNGIGERAGNASFEEVVAAISLKGIADTGVSMSGLTRMSKRVETMTGIVVPPVKAVVGEYAFTHSSGIHQDGVLKDPAVYECFPPSVVGREGHRFVLTARSGRAAVKRVMSDMGYSIQEDEMESFFDAFLKYADEADGPVESSQMKTIYDERRVSC
jgi:2-isopropylmalate synthase